MPQADKSISLLIPRGQDALPNNCEALGINYGICIGTILNYKQMWGLLAPMPWWQHQFMAMLPCAGTAVCEDLM